MKRNTFRLLTAALLLAGVQQAFAADLGTDADTTVSNQATVTFSVGGVVQSTTPTGDVDFKVDRKVDVIVAHGADATVTPGQTDGRLAYTVQNKTNGTLDFVLSTADGGGAFDATGLQIMVDKAGLLGASPGNGAVGTFDVGIDDTAPLTYINDLPEDATVTVWVVGTAPGTATTGQTNTIWLVARAAVPTGTDLAHGSVLSESGAADDPNVVENVFADGDGPATEVAQDGVHSAASTFTVDTADIAVTKSYKILFEDGANSTNFSPIGELKPIPGALVEFCILVTNGSATVGATGVQINDPLGTTPNTVLSSVNWETDSIRIGATCNDYATGSVEDDNTTDELSDETDGEKASYDSGTGIVSSEVDTVAAGASTATMFRVTIK